MEQQRKYISVNDIQKEYLPVSKKRIRSFIQQYLPVKRIGGRLFTDRTAFEELLADPDRERFPLN